MLVFLLAGIPLPARPADARNLLPLGVLMQASGAHFKAAKASAGATVYDGDGLSTEAEGALQFRGSAALPDFHALVGHYKLVKHLDLVKHL